MILNCECEVHMHKKKQKIIPKFFLKIGVYFLYRCFYDETAGLPNFQLFF